VNIRTAALGLAIAGLAVAGCNRRQSPEAAPDERRGAADHRPGAADHRTGAADRVGRSYPFRLRPPGCQSFRQAWRLRSCAVAARLPRLPAPCD